jgi:peptidyl-prolyl cis-trans isomerase SurA
MRNSFFYFGAAALLLWGCKATEAPVAQESILATIGGKPVYTSEFEYVYNKNNSTADKAFSRESIQEYLDLYTNFRLKVMDAESRGLDTTVAFKAELEGYKQQLAQPYLTEKSVTDKLVREAYTRMQQEINASHILINVAADAEPKDTLAAYNRIMDLRQRALAGENFEKLASTYSEDPSARDNQGNLGYFTALQMVYPFEDAAYKTPAGALTPPVRTRFGYHLIKVNDARPAQGEIKVAHIMVRATPGMPKADSVTAKKKIDEIYARVLRKENWDKLVSQFSEDASSAENGGELPWFGTGRMISSFEEAAFRLVNPGDLSQPVLTPYGWHIIKFLERRTLPPYEDMEPSLRSRVAKDSRSELNKAAFLKRIKAENNFQEMAPAKSYALGKADTTLLRGTWKNRFSAKETELPLFAIQNRRFTIQDFFSYVEQNQRPRQQTSPAHAMALLYDNFVNQSLVNYEKENLENKYVDYRMLVREYRDGILLFQLMDEKVWSKALEDTIGLNTYFQNHRDRYRWDTRAEATVLSAASPAILAQAQQLLARGRFEVRKNKPAPVLFDAGRALLNGRAKVALEELATRLAADTTLVLTITGQYTPAESRQLAQRRASQVQHFFTATGIAAARVPLSPPAKTAGKQRAVTLALHTTDLRVLEQNLNEKNPLAIQVSRRRFGKGENKLLDGVNWQPGTHTLQQDGRYYAIQIHQVLPPAPKQLNETRGLATSDYQAYLEKEWITQLRQRYPVEVKQAEVEKLIKK